MKIKKEGLSRKGREGRMVWESEKKDKKKWIG